MGKTRIEWTDRTWNPVTGCTKVSAGCINCYAERMAKRLRGRCGYPADDPFRVTLHPSRLEEPLRITKRSVFFVCSMGDLFHEDVPEPFINQVLGVIERAHWHVFLVLTKRAERMSKFFSDRLPPPNLWLGVSCEDATTARWRIDCLARTSGGRKFVSFEPLLAPIDPELVYGVSWVIAGCETGPGARPMHPDWVRSLRDLCDDGGYMFFLKQMMVDGKLVKLPALDGKSWTQRLHAWCLRT